MNSEESPLITVVVPFVNHRSHIQSCRDNILQQTYKNIELIFINNGSTDGSDLLAADLAKADPEKVKLFHEAKKGIPFARNRGLQEATGQYISFLDIDDRFFADKFERLHQRLHEFPDAAMAYGQTLRIYVDTGKKVIQDTGIAKPGVNYPPALPIDWTRSFYRLPQTGATLVRTSAARAVGGFPENLLLGNDDVGFHMHLALKYPVIFEPHPVIEYYRHAKSEGARLNEESSVHARYFDAHFKVTEPAGMEYFHSTGDMKLWGYAQKSLFHNYLDAFVKNQSFNHYKELKSRMFGYYKLIIQLYRILPFDIAQFVYKFSRRFVNFFNPLKYPIK